MQDQRGPFGTGEPAIPPGGHRGEDRVDLAAFLREAALVAWREAGLADSSVKNNGISNPAVVFGPAKLSTPANRSGSSSKRVNASLNSSVIFGVKAFFFATRSTVNTKM